MTFKVSESILMLKKAKNLGKYKIFLMAVYIIFKYGKRFRFAPSFNYPKIFIKSQRQIMYGSNFYESDVSIEIRSFLTDQSFFVKPFHPWAIQKLNSRGSSYKIRCPDGSDETHTRSNKNTNQQRWNHSIFKKICK